MQAAGRKRHDGDAERRLLQTVEAMKGLQQLLSTIVDASPFAILLVDAQGSIAFANRGAELLFGYARARLLEMQVEQLVPEPSREQHRLHRARFAQSSTERPMAIGRALTARREDGGEVPVEVALKPIEYRSASYVLAIVVDVSERRRLEQRVIEAHNELERRIEERTAELARATSEKERLLRDVEAKSRELERLSLEDPLTALSNRRDFDRRLLEWIHHCERGGEALTVAMFDIDHFKDVNDRFGHAVGDEVLKDTAALLRGECRSIDVVARYGGEEFALVLPNAGLDEAKAISERIRHAFEHAPWAARAAGLAPTISAGVASWKNAMSAEELLEHADLALYRAKHLGRNRVEA